MGHAIANDVQLVGFDADLLEYSTKLEAELDFYRERTPKLETDLAHYSEQAAALEIVAIQSMLRADQHRDLYQRVGEFLQLVTVGADPATVTAARQRMARAYEELGGGR